MSNSTVKYLTSAEAAREVHTSPPEVKFVVHIGVSVHDVDGVRREHEHYTQVEIDREQAIGLCQYYLTQAQERAGKRVRLVHNEIAGHPYIWIG